MLLCILSTQTHAFFFIEVQSWLWLWKKDSFIILSLYSLRSATRVLRAPISGTLIAYAQGRNEVRWRPGQEASLVPHVRNWGLSEANVLNNKSTCDIIGTYRRPPQWFGAPIVTRRRGIAPPLPPVTPLLMPTATRPLSWWMLHWWQPNGTTLREAFPCAEITKGIETFLIELLCFSTLRVD